MATVDDSERKIFSKEKILFLLPKHIVDFDCAQAPRKRVCESLITGVVLALVGFLEMP